MFSLNGSGMQLTIRKMIPSDAEDVLTIYREGVETGQATFEANVPEWKDWDISHLADLRFVAVLDDRIAGWIALSPVSGRCVYSGVAEVSVYIGKDFRGRGVGAELLELMTQQSEKAGLWTLQAGIFPENAASMRLHEKCGFRLVGYREKIGKMHGVWRDTVLLERRSNRVN